MNRNKNVESSQSKAERAYESLMKRREYQKKFQQNRRERLLDPKINSEEEINDYKEKMAEARLRSKNKKKRKRQHQISRALTPLSPQSAEPEEEAPPTEPPVAAASTEKEEAPPAAAAVAVAAAAAAAAAAAEAAEAPPLPAAAAAADIPSSLPCRVLFLGSEAAAGSGSGYGYSAFVYDVLRENSNLVVSYVKSEAWRNWKPHTFHRQFKDYDIIYIWATIQDILEDFALTSSAYEQWLDVLYSSHPKIIPSRRILDWIESKKYMLDLMPYCIPGSCFIRSSNEINTYLKILPKHLKSPFASTGRLHHVATIDNTSETQKFCSEVLGKLNRWCVICQPQIVPFHESKRIVTDRMDPDPIAQAVWSVAESLGFCLGWFRLDVVTINGKSYLNEIEKCNPMIPINKSRDVGVATAKIILEVFRKSPDSNVSNANSLSKEEIPLEFEYQKEFLYAKRYLRSKR